LLGVIPLERQIARWLPGWPVDVSWRTPLTFSGAPLIENGAAGEAFRAFIGGRGVPLILESFPADGPLWDTLCQTAHEVGAPIEILGRWERAALRPTGEFSTWFEKNFNSKRRKEYRRWHARLAQLGELQSCQWQKGQSVVAWLDAFADLEARSWKGQQGSALNSDPVVKACLAEALENLAIAGQLRFWSITLDGAPIASMFAIVVRDRAWLGKIAHSETFAKYSPGVLQILDATEYLFAEGGIMLADSCAIPEHPMMNNIWRDRVQMADILIGTPNIAVTRFRAMVAAEQLRRRARETAKDVYYRFMRRRKS